MKIRKVIEFLEHVEQNQGDAELEDITGFWTRVRPRDGKTVVTAVTGDGMTIAKLKQIAGRRDE